MNFKKNGIISLLKSVDNDNFMESEARDVYLIDILSRDLMEQMIQIKLKDGNLTGNEKLYAQAANDMNLKDEADLKAIAILIDQVLFQKPYL